MFSPAVVSLVKLGAGFAVSSGVSTMVGYAAKSSVPKVAPVLIRKVPSLVKGYHLFQKIAIPAGAVALAGMASEHAVKYAEKRIDENVKAAEQIQTDFEAAKDLKARFKKQSAESDSAEGK